MDGADGVDTAEAVDQRRDQPTKMHYSFRGISGESPKSGEAIGPAVEHLKFHNKYFIKKQVSLSSMSDADDKCVERINSSRTRRRLMTKIDSDKCAFRVITAHLYYYPRPPQEAHGTLSTWTHHIL